MITILIPLTRLNIKGKIRKTIDKDKLGLPIRALFVEVALRSKGARHEAAGIRLKAKAMEVRERQAHR